ncbi:glycoprotein 3-alpha-L-fucosyltransferase A [Anoplophora glabripennis]|uniref:glycoprotein 3-alpha-L-fucosyltransferase A n=1 Tax=Anoplophora glabripennis TaxID=217634 RepID=UPI000874A6E8|nr:glycoprotein 3-alpha-L-fucosyltransferase A [Anoplophora glabripennis]XP_018565857.1 glycoprotein 3-alpha-L-fucosyltransferase A [Anoplophora glabripennis]XP_018565858.1 glycoprotein 3-alpha-L-fucosyltransferase A [Anoplophora glabripennis]
MGRTTSLQRKSYVIFTVVLLITTACVLFQPQNGYEVNPYLPSIESVWIESEFDDIRDNEDIKKWLELRRTPPKNLSKLGRILFLDEEEPNIQTGDNRYQILVWKYGSKIENRHLKQFSDKKMDPFRHCSVKNCDITYSDSTLKTADLVLFHLHRMTGIQDLPKEKRNPNQIWAFLTDESPHHTFLKRKVKMNEFDGVFNWSMTYRMDSDIPVPYGRTVLKKQSEQKIMLTLNKRKDVLITILGSNCGGTNHRWDYVKELQKYIKIDIYGGCGPLKTCPGHFRTDCPAVDKYLFYLSFENSNCDEYITEKLWWNAYYKKSIPIVMGADVENYRKMLPLNSYINVDDFASPAVLAQFIYRLNETGEYREYYKWKTDFEVLNEHGYFKSESFHFCRICQALNYNDKSTKVYEKLDDFWSVKKDCHPAWNA